MHALCKLNGVFNVVISGEAYQVENRNGIYVMDLSIVSQQVDPSIVRKPGTKLCTQLFKRINLARFVNNPRKYLSL